jgi:hypothetical protein
MKAEPLVMVEYPLKFNMISEVLPEFASSADAVACPRLRPRNGQQLRGITPQALALSFTRWSATCYEVSGGDATTLRSKAADVDDHTTVCVGHVMTGGRHAAKFTVGEVFNIHMLLELARPRIDVDVHRAWHIDEFVGMHDGDGTVYTEDHVYNWDEQDRFDKGDVVGLLLECDAGTLTVKKNGTYK